MNSKIFGILSSIALLYACGGGGTPSASNATDLVTTTLDSIESAILGGTIVIF
jgi:hypothetical protein